MSYLYLESVDGTNDSWKRRAEYLPSFTQSPVPLCLMPPHCRHENLLKTIPLFSLTLSRPFFVAPIVNQSPFVPERDHESTIEGHA
ncbi:hypothetical protein E2C01_039681 [Portunus trituberculatus]|uniref:Uncharacterized protein n=1 Tax=Portunus trituberculatus TaxID=210409 RepID=A0A5B7FKG8_PORTR|nr:hypothetical protein [Portunus trituberculatus]